MKNKLWILLLLAFGLAACQNIEPEPDPEPEREVDPPIEEPVVALNERIGDGRHVTAYVTYYGSLTPDAKVLTHINYAFA